MTLHCSYRRVQNENDSTEIQEKQKFVGEKTDLKPTNLHYPILKRNAKTRKSTNSDLIRHRFSLHRLSLLESFTDSVWSTLQRGRNCLVALAFMAYSCLPFIAHFNRHKFCHQFSVIRCSIDVCHYTLYKQYILCPKIHFKILGCLPFKSPIPSPLLSLNEGT